LSYPGQFQSGGPGLPARLWWACPPIAVA